MKPIASWSTLLPCLLAIGLTAGVLHARSGREILPQHQDLASFPTHLDAWVGTDIPLVPYELAVLGNGEFLVRDYTRGNESSINLFLAFYASQRSGDTIHSPRNCLPGAGWTALKSGELQIRRASGTPIHVNRYIVGQGSERMLVLYWYQSHGRITPSEYWAKIFLVTDAMRLNRTDGALIRVLTSIEPREDESKAQARAVEFTERILPLLDPRIPR